MIDNENKVIQLKENPRKITIEIPTDLLIQVFYDTYEDVAKIKNKKIFREEFAESIRDKLEDIIQEISDEIVDNEECIKMYEEIKRM